MRLARYLNNPLRNSPVPWGNQLPIIYNDLGYLNVTLDIAAGMCYLFVGGAIMVKDALRRSLAYASLGAAKVAAKRAWESDSYVTSTLSAAEAGMWTEAAKNLLGPEIGEVLPKVPEGYDEKE
jgi:hypothetical protein